MMAQRKSFSGAGRIVPKRRERSGRIQRPEDSRGETVAEIKSVVLFQPHRRGAAEPLAWDRVTVIGRLILDGQVRHSAHSPATLLEAARRYRADWDYYQSKRLASRRPLAVTEGRTIWDNPEREAEERLQAERRWGNASRALRDCGERVEKAMQFAILDDQPEGWSPPFWLVHSLPIGLAALVALYGLE
jgi:hypothetical protein